jgi:cell wall assembly regulator SMI1
MSGTDWRSFVASLTSEATFFPPADETAIRKAEDRLGVRLPSELRSLYTQSNGVRGEHELGLIWPVEQVLEDNLMFRRHADFPRLYMPFEALLFFADAGNGDQFAHAILAGEVRRPDVFVWDHETDGRIWAAPDLRTYLDWWLSGRLEV